MGGGEAYKGAWQGTHKDMRDATLPERAQGPAAGRVEWTRPHASPAAGALALLGQVGTVERVQQNG